jgi:amino acid permease
MKKNNKHFFQATSVMVGYIIGVGMFGLPYVVSRAGLLPFFLFLVLLLPVQYLLHLVYASMIVNTKTYHRLPGYAGIYLGKGAKIFIFIAKMVGNMGALLAYIIITGVFLNELLSPLFGNHEFVYASVLFAIEAAIVYFGIGMIAKAELFITALLVFVVLLIIARGLPFVEVDNFIALDWEYFILPYGALLFSLDGNGSLPIVAKLVKRDPKLIKQVIRFATFISAFIIILFTLTIAGISGANTTPDALIGVHAIMDGAIILALIFGIFSMITSFFGVAESVKETLNWDFKVSRFLSWALAVFIPYSFYLFGVRNLSDVIILVGSIGGGICAIFLIMIFNKIRKKRKGMILFDYKPAIFLQRGLIILFILGIVYTICEYIKCID